MAKLEFPFFHISRGVDPLNLIETLAFFVGENLNTKQSAFLYNVVGC